MIHITIHDDQFPTCLKEMSITINPKDFQGSKLTFHGVTNRLNEEVRKQAKELLDSWWSHRNRTKEEIWGEEEKEGNFSDECIA